LFHYDHKLICLISQQQVMGWNNKLNVQSPTNNNGQTMLTFGLFDTIMLEGQLEKSQGIQGSCE